MKQFEFYFPTKIYFGCGKINIIEDLISQRIKNILIVSEKNLAAKSDAIQKIQNLLKTKNVITFLNVEENPTFENVEEGKEFIDGKGIQLIIGIGGGSPMDAAKGIAAAAVNKENIRKLISLDDLPNNPLPLVCIPTTSGTGSEVTPYAVFTDKITENKVGYANNKIFPVAAVIDPELSYSMPRQVIINTGLDALAHSIEAFLSLNSSPLSDAIALEAVKICLDNLEKASLQDKEAMDKMSYASMLGGLAITQAGTILPHIMGYPLTVYHNVPHGKACIILLPSLLSLLRKNSSVKEKIKYLESLFEAKGGIEIFLKNLNVSLKLSDYGVKKDEVEIYVKKVIVKSDVKITPAEITEKDIKELYNSMF